MSWNQVEEQGLRRARLLGALAAERVSSACSLSGIELWDSVLAHVPDLLVPDVKVTAGGKPTLIWENRGNRVVVELREADHVDYTIVHALRASTGRASIRDMVDLLIIPLAAISGSKGAQ